MTTRRINPVGRERGSMLQRLKARSRRKAGLVLGALLLLPASRALALDMRVYVRTDGSTPRTVITWTATCVYPLPAPLEPGQWLWTPDRLHWTRHCGGPYPLDTWVNLAFEDDGLSQFNETPPTSVWVYPSDHDYSPAIGGYASGGPGPVGEITIHAHWGSIEGRVVTEDGIPIPNMDVYAFDCEQNDPGEPCPRVAGPKTTDGAGYFTFDPPGSVNHWGLPVPGTDGDPSGTLNLRSGYYAYIRGYTLVAAPTGAPPPAVPDWQNPPPGSAGGLARSSEITWLDIRPWTEIEMGENSSNAAAGGGRGRGGEQLAEPDNCTAGCDPLEPPPPQELVGEPVNVMTGDVSLVQTDAGVAGVRRVVSLTRSYSSQRAFAGKIGAFGRGWEHSLDKRITMNGTILLRLNNGTTAPIYFQDTDGDNTFRAWSPRSEASWIVKTQGGFVRHFQQGGQEDYDAQGRLTRQLDAVGNTTSLQRDAAGHISAIVAPGGRTLTFGYVGDLVVSLGGPDGQIATYQYGGGSSLTRVDYTSGESFVFTYDANGQLLILTDATGRTLETHTYNGNKGITSSLADGREAFSFSYPSQYETAVTDSLGHVRRYSHSVVGGRERVSEIRATCPSCAAGTVAESWQYDDAGRITAHTNAVGERRSYTRATEGYVAATADWNGNTTATERDAQARITSLTAPDNSTTTMTYVAAGPRTLSDPLGRTTTITYDTRGLPNQISTPLATAHNKAKILTYTAEGDLESVTDELGHTTTYAYDSFGRLTRATDPAGTVQLARDAAGRVTRVTYPDGSHSDTTYDAAGRRLSTTDPAGRITKWTYDPYGRVQVVEDPAHGATWLAYDLMSRLTSLTDARNQTTRWVYDELGRVSSIDSPGSKSVALSYGPDNRLQSRTDRRGVITTFTYDNQGRLARTSFSDGTPGIAYGYDVVGRLLSAGNGSDLLKWTYNAAGQVVSEKSSFNAATVGYEYDATGLANRLTLDGSRVAQYGVDDAGRLTTITHGSSTFTLAYDNASRRLSLSYPNGIVSGYSYDANSSLLGITSQRAGSPVQQISYTYDTVGNRTTKTIDALQETYSYDPLSRLTAVARTGTTPRRWRFDYDAVGNRVTDQTDGVTLTAAFDPNNQLLSLTPGGKMHLLGEIDEAATVSVAGQPAGMTGARTFEAEVDVTPGTNSIPIVSTDGAGNSRTQVYEVEVGGDAATFEYDDNGNTTQKTSGGHTWTYQWNALNQLTAVSKDGQPAASFKYDPLGRRIEKTAGGLSYRFTYSGQDIVRETQSSGTSYTYIHGPGIDEPLARLDQAGAVAYFHADGLGSIVATTDASGAVASRRQYDAWGNLEVGADQAGYAFTGREWDPETGLYYYRARYYDPKIGRFISEDAIGLAGGANLYEYVGNSPIGRFDPMGDDWIDSAANGVAGFGDALTFGQATNLGNSIAYQWSDIAGWDEGVDGVDRCSTAYKLGEWTGVAWSVALGAAGGVRAAGAKGVGKEFSHWIPNRMGGPRSVWNGNYVTTAEHALSDPYRYRFMPRAWKMSNPMPNRAIQQMNRLPYALGGTAAGAGYGLASRSVNECGCQN